MTTWRLLLHFLATFILLFTDFEVSAEIRPSEHYENCWQVVEKLCEKKTSNGCPELVKLCGNLLTDHLSHRNGNCPYQEQPTRPRRNKKKYLKHYYPENSIAPRLFDEPQRKEHKVSRRSNPNIRGMLTPDKAPTFTINMEKPEIKTSTTARPLTPRKSYKDTLRSYRTSFLATKTKLVQHWLARNNRAFTDFLTYWKNQVLREKRAASTRS